MKKEYQSPIMELNLFIVEDVMSNSNPDKLGGLDFLEDGWFTNK